MAGERVEEIVGEIERAQGNDVAPGEVLARISPYLKKEPSLTVPLIEAMARIPNPETAQLLIEMMGRAEEKWVIKCIKRTLYKLRQKGVRWEERSSRGEPVLRPPRPPEPQGYLGAKDAGGSRIIVIARPQPLRGLFVVLSIVNDLEGIVDFSLRELSRKGFDEFVKTSLPSADLPVGPAPGAYCIHLLKEAASLSRRLSRPLPRGYHDTEARFKDVTWDDPDPIVYQYIKEDEVKDRAHLLKESTNLHEITPFSAWFLEDKDIQGYVSGIKDAHESRIVLTPDQKNARLNGIYRKALEELFPEEKRMLWKRRLEEMAFILLKSGKEKEARAALSAAVDLENPFSPFEPNPFIWNLLLKSIYTMIKSDYEEKQKKAPLIVTP